MILLNAAEKSNRNECDRMNNIQSHLIYLQAGARESNRGALTSRNSVRLLTLNTRSNKFPPNDRFSFVKI